MVSLYIDAEEARIHCVSLFPKLSFCAQSLFERVLANKSGKEKN